MKTTTQPDTAALCIPKGISALRRFVCVAPVALLFANSASGMGTLEIAQADTGGSITVNPAMADSFAPDVLRLTSGTLLLVDSSRMGDSPKSNFTGSTSALNNFPGGATGIVGLGSMMLSESSALGSGPGTGANLAGFGGTGAQTSGTGALQIMDYQNGSAHPSFTWAAGDFPSDSGQGDVSFSGVSGSSAIRFSSSFAIVAVPEPTTILGVLGLLGFIGYRERRRMHDLWNRRVLD